MNFLKLKELNTNNTVGSFNAAAFLVKHMKEFCHLITKENGILIILEKEEGHCGFLYCLLR